MRGTEKRVERQRLGMKGKTFEERERIWEEACLSVHGINKISFLSATV